MKMAMEMEIAMGRIIASEMGFEMRIEKGMEITKGIGMAMCMKREMRMGITKGIGMAMGMKRKMGLGMGESDWEKDGGKESLPFSLCLCLFLECSYYSINDILTLVDG